MGKHVIDVVRQEIVNHNLLVKALIQVMLDSHCNNIGCVTFKMIGYICQLHSYVAVT